MLRSDVVFYSKAGLGVTSGRERKKVWVLHQQRKVPCKNRHRRCLATSEVTFCQNPSPAFLTRRAQQCSVAFHLEQDRLSLTTPLHSQPYPLIILWRPVSTKLRARIMDRWKCHSYPYYERKRGNISDRSESTVPPQQSISQPISRRRQYTEQQHFLPIKQYTPIHFYIL